MKSVVILISGRGSNMQAIVAAQLRNMRIAAIIANRADAEGLQFAQGKQIPTHVVDHTQYATRPEFDTALAQCIDIYHPDLVILAGFMRVLGEKFVRHYSQRMLNIHPSLLPSFQGLHTHRQALQAGVKLHGATVHFVTADLDCGPIVIQAAVPVLEGDDEASLAQRVLAVEHRIYPQAVQWFVNDQIQFDSNGRVKLVGISHALEIEKEHLYVPNLDSTS